MNKFDLVNKVLTSTLKADDKNLLIELILRTNYDEHKNWDCWPSVERLAQVRGMKNERHFKGVDFYLPGLASKRKNGRKNVYTINPEAIMALEPFKVTLQHTPALAADAPAVEVNTPSVAADTPAVEGANITSNTTNNTTEETTQAPVVPPVAEPSLILKNDKEEAQESTPIDLNGPDAVVPIDTTVSDTPSVAGVSDDDYYEWNGRKVRKVGRGDPFGGVTTAPVEPEVKTPCPKCSVPMDKDLCWNFDCL